MRLILSFKKAFDLLMDLIFYNITEISNFMTSKKSLNFSELLFP